MKHLLITGANGQLGNEMRVLAERFPNMQFTFTDVAELDICDAAAINDFLDAHRADYIINCAAYTAVDRAESDAERCRTINAVAPKLLGEAAARRGARVVHISTDYVYSGSACRPYTESDPVAPTSVYGATKLEGEQLLFGACREAMVLRTSWLYSTFGNNFVKTMIRLGRERAELGVIFDQVGTPTYARDLAMTILSIIDGDKFAPGVYNFSNEGVCSWYDFALKIHELAGVTGCKVRPIETAEYPTPAVRPHYSVMNKRKLKETFGTEVAHWESALRRCFADMV
jgi:dTDP-4-dehydrorhamnose reductase